MHAGPLLRFLALSIPIDGRVTPLVGVGDLLVLGALFVGLLHIHGQAWRAAAVLVVGLFVAIAVGLYVGGVAGLPFLGAAAMLDAWVASRSDRTAVAEGGDGQDLCRSH